MESQQLKNIVEAALLAAGGPLTVDQIKGLFADDAAPEKAEIREQLAALTSDYAERGIEIREVASGFRVQVREEMGQWLTKLWEERPPRYTRALMETLAIIAYRQPVTRGDIEEIRGVSVSSNIIRTMLERDWVKVVGHRDVPGKPAIFGTTRFFLDYFGLKKLDDLPPLAELAELEPVSLQLELGTADQRPHDDTDNGDDSDTENVDGNADDSVHDGVDSIAHADQPAEPAATVGVDTPDIDPLAVDDGPADLVDGNAALEQGTEPELATDAAERRELPDDADRLDAEDSPDDSVDADADADDDNVSSLDDARDAAAREPETDFNAERAEVVPIKKS